MIIMEEYNFDATKDSRPGFTRRPFFERPPKIICSIFVATDPPMLYAEGFVGSLSCV